MNLEQLASDLGLDMEDFIELTDLFVETTGADLTKLETAVASGNVTGTVEVSHSIKGASGNLGFREIHELAKVVESNARRGVLDGSMDATQKMKVHLVEVANVLKAAQAS